jgi:hypothetical protein
MLIQRIYNGLDGKELVFTVIYSLFLVSVLLS